MALYRQPSQPCTKTVKTRMLFISRIRMKMMLRKLLTKVRDLDVVYVLDVSFGADSKTVFKKWLDEGKSLMWIDHHKGIIEDSKT